MEDPLLSAPVGHGVRSSNFRESTTRPLASVSSIRSPPCFSFPRNSPSTLKLVPKVRCRADVSLQTTPNSRGEGDVGERELNPLGEFPSPKRNRTLVRIVELMN